VKPTPLIEARGLTKHFSIPGSRKTVQACNDVSFMIGPGETLGLIGESGSGKTTVGRCVLRLLSVDQGEILFRGTRIDNLRSSHFRPYRKHMQIVFQEPFESLDPLFTVGQAIEEPLREHTGLSSTQRRKRTEELLDTVGVSRDAMDAQPRELSTGVQQRVAIARALAPEPEFIVLDEPTSALPPDAKPEVIQLLKNLQSQMQLGYLFISHDLTLVSHFCDRVAVMYLSRIIEEGTRDQVLANPAHPYSQALLSAVLLPDPWRRNQLERRVVRLKGEIPSPIDLPPGCYLENRCPFATRGCEEPQLLEQLTGSGHFVRCWRAIRGTLPQHTREVTSGGGKSTFQ
jgi:oligopeptide/dipeptide ABC transporter ATP-binding protein